MYSCSKIYVRSELGWDFCWILVMASMNAGQLSLNRVHVQVHVDLSKQMKHHWPLWTRKNSVKRTQFNENWCNASGCNRDKHKQSGTTFCLPGICIALHGLINLAWHHLTGVAIPNTDHSNCPFAPLYSQWSMHAELLFKTTCMSLQVCPAL